ncbi:Lrp/AsnC family transcriptional regulator [Sphingobium sp. H39-3-25]|uniref:Lrp/AsnC family transcriptional regulator n=1 Tax=Sphingobium arseniciresistens TaxID=3030834 RepID=UPI0023B948CC|nr:Lrp/AsnC family transcriptional regulator [Sphingobium arseniciresistens]
MPESTYEGLDSLDFRILAALVEDGRVSDVSLAETIGLSSTSVARRRKILEEKGVIRGYGADLDLLRLGYAMTAVVMIELTSQAVPVLAEFEEAVTRCPSISFGGFVSGVTDFMIMLRVQSFADYDHIYRSELSALPHVAKISTSFVLRQVLDRAVPPIILSEEAKPDKHGDKG